jgi:hypothetical protein
MLDRTVYRVKEQITTGDEASLPKIKPWSFVEFYGYVIFPEFAQAPL